MKVNRVPYFCAIKHYPMEEQRVETHEIREINYKRTDWLIFLLGSAATIALLYFDNRFFWIALPFALTYLVKSLRMM